MFNDMSYNDNGVTVYETEAEALDAFLAQPFSTERLTDTQFQEQFDEGVAEHTILENLETYVTAIRGAQEAAIGMVIGNPDLTPVQAARTSEYIYGLERVRRDLRSIIDRSKS